MTDSYRTLAKDVISESKKIVDFLALAFRDPAYAHIRQWQRRLEALDHECSKVLKKPVE